jgi:hypothetical protein
MVLTMHLAGAVSGFARVRKNRNLGKPKGS